MSDPGNFDPLFEACVSDSFSRIRESFLFSRVKRDSARVHADTPASEIRRFPPSGFDLRLDGSVAVSGRIPKVLASTAVAPESRLEFAANRAENPIEKGRFTHVWTWFAATLDVKHGESV